MDNHTAYLLELFHSQIERNNYREASSLLNLLTPRLHSYEIKRLQAKIPKLRSTKTKVQKKKVRAKAAPSVSYLAKSIKQYQRSIKRSSKVKKLPAAASSKYPTRSEITKRRLENKQRKKDLRAAVDEREIEFLVHFTQACNVTSILKNGLIPRKQLASKLGHKSKNVQVNDRLRNDGHTDASCLSISFPNYLMFYRYRNQLAGTAWVTLLIDSKVLWAKDCAFYNCNAASWKMSATPVRQLKPVSAFNALFDDYLDNSICVKRSHLRLPDSMTTNPQAEVLVFDVITKQDIAAVCLPNHSDTYSRYCADWQGFDTRIEPVYFGPRVDFEYWSNRKK